MWLITLILLTTTQLLLCEAGNPRPKCHDPNATPNPCASQCPPTCENPTPTCTFQCKVNGCVCNNGYIYDVPDGKCIPISECPGNPRPKCHDPNATPNPCASQCPPTCENPTPTCTRQCKVNGCVCNNGYIYDVPDGKCIPISECPGKCCKKNERWVNCVLSECIPKRCEELGNPIACPSIAGHCDGGCICKEGYLRNKKDICIPEGQCPTCGGSRNATAGCGTHCGNLCSNYKNKSLILCADICYYNSCDCKEEYVYNDIINKCIKPEDCPKPCKGDPYAISKPCASAHRPTCDYPEEYKGDDDTCVKNGCECVSGYVLDGEKCIKREYCPKNENNDEDSQDPDSEDDEGEGECD